jgi:hypothetical protein
MCCQNECGALPEQNQRSPYRATRTRVHTRSALNGKFNANELNQLKQRASSINKTENKTKLVEKIQIRQNARLEPPTSPMAN